MRKKAICFEPNETHLIRPFVIVNDAGAVLA